MKKAFAWLGWVAASFVFPAAWGATCNRTIVADVVAIDQPLMFNRLGAQNVNGMIFALRRDVVNKNTLLPEAAGGVLAPGQVVLRPDKRPRPLTLRVNEGDCLQVNFQNLLAPQANPNNAPDPALLIDDQVADRFAGFHVMGMQWVNGPGDDASFVGRNPNSLVPPGGSITYTLYAEKEGTYLATSYGATFGGEGTGGNLGSGLFGAVNVEPKGAKYYRSQVTEEELRLATQNTTPDGHPVIDYEARYPNEEPWISEGKAGLPVLNMLDGNRLVHSDVNAIIAGPNPDGTFPASTYPLESQGKRNPTVPNRLEPFREFTTVFHDEVASAQAFPGFFFDPVLLHTLAGVRDAFMINYSSGGIGSEILANRLRVGPMHDCLGCKYEEFFLTSWTVGDPGMVVDVPANAGLERVGPNPGVVTVKGFVEEALDPAFQGPKANFALYPDDPGNVHHSYIGDFTKFRNIHAGPKEHHIFHLHSHQWLFNANDDNSNYLDSQGIGPGSGYTYEINFGGSGNRNKTPGDAIFHCHFYPHFAMGMWALWRNHDVFEPGTRLGVSGNGFHTDPWALAEGKPAPGARALPDGEIAAGTPIPAVVPLPGKPLPPMPGAVTVVAKDADGDGVPESSQAQVVERDKNPGYPFYIAGIEDTVGQRPTTPALDMLASAGGWDGGLPRHTLDGFAAGGEAHSIETRLDFSKEVLKAKAHFYPEEGTDVEQVAMAFHARRCHDTFLPDGSPAACQGDDVNGDGLPDEGGFITNGQPPVPGAPFAEPCMDDTGKRLTAGAMGQFFDGNGGLNTLGIPEFGADNPRIYKAAVIQLDVALNKVGWHFPQERIITLWEDVQPTLDHIRPPEPFAIRLNTFDCASFLHTNLVPKDYELDDFQVKTPTDVIGQHIHLVKFDVTASDGAANGWNYEDGTLSPGEVQERILAINAFPGQPVLHNGVQVATPLSPKPHPFFGAQIGHLDAMGARTTIQRWFADPVVNTAGVDRGLGIVFTHDHFGPSTHQQIGLYATVLVEPAGSTWVHNETGELLGTRHDGGPTTWQAAILTGDIDGDGKDDSYREFYLEYADFQHAYEKGVFVGVDAQGNVVPPDADSFRVAINPSVREENNPLFPDMVVFPNVCPGGVPRPCPEAISVDDPGTFVVNYRNEPVALRVFDPNKIGPDGKPGAQADGKAGDLAFAYQSRQDRAIPELNTPLGATPYPPLTGDVKGGDPFTPIMRTLAGDKVRVKIQVGAHEEGHVANIHGVKWLQEGSGFGESPNSGWRNAQFAGISEQFTLNMPVNADIAQRGGVADYLYTVDASQDGMWNGVWGVMRNYNKAQKDLVELPSNDVDAVTKIANKQDFQFGVCPKDAPVRAYDVAAVAARDVLPTEIPGVGKTLIYNPRPDVVQDVGVFTGGQGPLHDPTALLYVMLDDLEPAPATPEEEAACAAGGVTNPACPVRLKDGAPIEPLVLRASAGDCVRVTLLNRLPDPAPDLDGLTLLPPIVKRLDQPNGFTTFNNNLIRPSSNVGLHPQLVEYDVTRSDGVNVGQNGANQTAAPGGSITYTWYAGDLDAVIQGKNAQLIATPVEFGGSNLIPADKVKQPQKGLMGALVVEPQGTGWVEDTALDPVTGQVRLTRASATVMDGAGNPLFRDFVQVWQEGINLRYADNSPVQNIGAEGVQGVAEDAEDSGGAAVNYRAEPLWFRFGFPPHLPFELQRNVVNNHHEAYSNALVGGDPVTPIFTASPHEPMRMRVVMAGGTARNKVFNLHGHLWQRQPYLAGQVPSQTIGANPLAFYRGGQEGLAASQHFDFVPLHGAGGYFGVPGDYLYRDQASFGNMKGLWGILRVE